MQRLHRDRLDSAYFWQILIVTAIESMTREEGIEILA